MYSTYPVLFQLPPTTGVLKGLFVGDDLPCLVIVAKAAVTSLGGNVAQLQRRKGTRFSSRVRNLGVSP